jgi:hypothetical protein
MLKVRATVDGAADGLTSGATISTGSRREISGNSGGARTRTGWRARIAAGLTSQVRLAPRPWTSAVSQGPPCFIVSSSLNGDASMSSCHVSLVDDEIGSRSIPKANDTNLLAHAKFRGAVASRL